MHKEQNGLGIIMVNKLSLGVLPLTKGRLLSKYPINGVSASKKHMSKYLFPSQKSAAVVKGFLQLKLMTSQHKWMSMPGTHPTLLTQKESAQYSDWIEFNHTLR
jgi:hypothetical protein